MRVLVCGGRHYKDQARAFDALDILHAVRDITLVIEGGAEGGDRMARYWAKSRGVPCMTIDAQWGFYGRGAGHIRNGWMIEFGLPDLCAAFPGGRGTDNMKKQSLAAEIEVVSLI